MKGREERLVGKRAMKSFRDPKIDDLGDGCSIKH